MLPDSPHVEEVILGAGGVLENAEPGLLLIDMSTIRPDTSTKVAEEATARGVRALDAPVSGGEKGAIDGVLSIMVGGEEDVFTSALPILEVLGKTIVHVGPSGAGQTVKAANQLVVGGTYALVAEAIVLLEASGVDAGRGLDVLAGGLAGSRILELKRESMVARQFAPGFRIDLHHKDMGIALAAAREAGVALPVTGLIAQLIAAAKAQGYGSLDHSVLLKVLENVSGRTSA
jgi:2-hydroxy-3-oxopropionate reductase